MRQALPPLNWQQCHAGSDGDGGRESAYFVSARKADAQGKVDMAFVWSSWTQGIESWRFHLGSHASRHGDEGEGQLPRWHTVFDRTLLRAGQTLSMKHLARTEQLVGLSLSAAESLPTLLRIQHQGSGQKFEFPLAWRNGRHAESTFALPQDAKLGLYAVSLVGPGGRRQRETGVFRVEEFRLPVMTGRIVPPKQALVQPSSGTLDGCTSACFGGTMRPVVTGRRNSSTRKTPVSRWRRPPGPTRLTA